MKTIKKLIIFLYIFMLCQPSFASRGGLDKDGCHTDKKTGKYHCHKQKNN